MTIPEFVRIAVETSHEARKIANKTTQIAGNSSQGVLAAMTANQAAEASKMAAYVASQLSNPASNDPQIRMQMFAAAEMFAQAAKATAHAAAICRECVEKSLDSDPKAVIA